MYTILSLSLGLLSLQCQPLPVQRTQRIGVAGRHWERVGVAGVGRISLSSAIPFEDSRYILNPLQRRLSIPAQRGPISFKFKGKAINLWSLAYAAVTLCVALVILPFMMLMTVLVDLFGNKRVTLECAEVLLFLLSVLF